MKQTIDETNRRRRAQVAYNKKHKITPTTIVKAVKTSPLKGLDTKDEFKKEIKNMSSGEKDFLLHSLEQQMQLAAANLEFETAARLRDQITLLKQK